MADGDEHPGLDLDALVKEMQRFAKLVGEPADKRSVLKLIGRQFKIDHKRGLVFPLYSER